MVHDDSKRNGMLRNYPATKERKTIIGDIHGEYQIEMDKKAEMKKKEKYNYMDTTGHTSKISTETGTNNCHDYYNASTGHWNLNFDRSPATSSRTASTDDGTSTTNAYAGHIESEQNAICHNIEKRTPPSRERTAHTS
uniref:Uncharacterized protein n=1 Tax=Romanomermis culicivorax TaxID=13658 RepID=A0A915HV34_ROMCU